MTPTQGVLEGLDITDETALILLHTPDSSFPEGIRELQLLVDQEAGRHIQIVIVPPGYSLEVVHEETMNRMGWVRAE